MGTLYYLLSFSLNLKLFLNIMFTIVSCEYNDFWECVFPYFVQKVRSIYRA